MASSKSSETTENKRLNPPVPDIDCDNAHQQTDSGIGNFRPAVLRMCSSIPGFTGVYSVSALITSTLTTYVSSPVTTLERHFGFSSAQTGLLLAANNVGFLIVILFVSFIASRIHIPRALGFFTLLFGVSGIVCALPHFFFGAPSPPSLNGADVSAAVTSGRPSGNFRGQLCVGVNQVNCSVTIEDPSVASDDLDPGSRARAYSGTALAILVVGMVLLGVAKAPRGSFCLYYVDCNVEKVKSGFYMGIIITLSFVGPAVAFALGGIFTRIYVTLDETGLHHRHPRWIGAWWLGFLTFGCAACVVALPIFCFPRRIQRHSQSMQGTKAKADTGTSRNRMVHFAKGFVQALVRLLTCPVYLCCALSTCAVVFALVGSQSFSPKYIENQFAFPAWKANMAMAGMTIGTASVGTFAGGLLSRRYKMGPMGCLKLVIVVMTLCAVCSGLMLLFHCPQPLLHHSPGSNYVNCTCIESGGTAVAETCDYSCDMFYPFIVCFCLTAFFSALSIVPHLLAYIRAVETRDKALALGLCSFLHSITGYMLGPICFGKMIDSICIQWEDSCTGGGACLLYDNDDFRWKLLGYQTIFRVGALFFIILAYIFARLTKPYGRKGQELTGNDVMVTVMVGQCREDSNTSE